MFGEIGVLNADGFAEGFSYYNLSNKIYDNQESADIWCTYLIGAQELGISSINVWQFSVADYYQNWEPGADFLNIGFRQPISPNYRILKAIIGPDTPSAN